jgi:hypothetical protein
LVGAKAKASGNPIWAVSSQNSTSLALEPKKALVVSKASSRIWSWSSAGSIWSNGRKKGTFMVPYLRNTFSLVAALCVLTPLLCVAEQAPDSADDRAPLFLSFQVPGSTATFPQSINDLMVITGSYFPTAGGQRGFVRYGDGSIITFAVTGAMWTQPASINNAGDITGSYAKAPTYDPTILSVEQGFVRAADGTISTFGNPANGDDGLITFLPLAINAAGEVVGYENDKPGLRGFRRFASGTIQEFALFPDNPTPTMMTGLNDSGAIVGLARNQGTVGLQGFLWSGKGHSLFPWS